MPAAGAAAEDWHLGAIELKSFKPIVTARPRALGRRDDLKEKEKAQPLLG